MQPSIGFQWCGTTNTIKLTLFNHHGYPIPSITLTKIHELEGLGSAQNIWAARYLLLESAFFVRVFFYFNMDGLV
jgi:hypothetical protein